jgi:hypothetical protein
MEDTGTCGEGESNDGDIEMTETGVNNVQFAPHREPRNKWERERVAGTGISTGGGAGSATGQLRDAEPLAPAAVAAERRRAGGSCSV